ncbi:transporter substrate-binding domain-containing protein [Psychrobium sp. MM17-31]|uniref:substrate-binding periplasmic protein n=1 Tax=Psychrobium sp. MM17-31 TaxID=2917758 RepID=UPI001EF4D177|nr:transporter substrate-binding domain-containing protein [Psychrobium sp. MM17-31]MCG7530424.1 transporter substrate-binding domain-containing protein [Psychrobium sp. MM17-31]
MKFLLGIALFFSIASSANAESTEKCELKVGWMERPSYQYKKRSGQPTGFDIEYVKLIGKELGCEVNFRYIPWMRQIKELADGKLDLLLGTVPSGADLGVYVLTDVYRKDPMGFYRLKSNPSVGELKSLTEVVRAGFRFGFNFHDIRTPEMEKLRVSPGADGKVMTQKNAKGLLRNLNQKHIDGVILHSAEVDYLKSINDPLVKDIVLVPHLSFHKSVAMVSATTADRGLEIVNKVNSAIKVLKENGSQEKLVKKFAPSHALIK